MASSRRKLDEKHLKLIRELGSQADNRTCFDCHQRGTTYINMTVGSFVCTSCSGILRGINPPHRVKSISMASFTAEEIQLIKSKGNQYCSAVWLGLYDAQRNPFPETKDEHKIRDFMITKYEKKRFYVDPSIALKNMPPATNSPGSSSNASTPSSDNKSTVARPAVSRPNVPTSQSSGSLGVILSSVAVSGSKSSTPKSQSSIDLLAECLHGSVTAPASTTTSDPFAGAPTSTPAAPQTADALNKQESFANFENANIFTNTDTTSTSSSTAMSAAPAPMAPSTFSNAPLLPLNPSSSSSSALPANGTAAPTATPASAVSASDRYAALKDLDEVFRTAKEEPPAPAPPPQTNGGAPWGTANSNNQSSNSATVFGSPPNGGVFGSPSTSAFGGFMNGGNGVFGTPPGTNNTGGSFFPQQAVTQNTAPTASQPWTANFSGQNPFGGGSSNNTWMNGGNSAFGAPTPNGGSNAFGAPTQNGSSNAFGTPTPNGGSNAFGTPATNGVSTAFGVPTPNQQNFTQPNPFGTTFLRMWDRKNNGSSNSSPGVFENNNWAPNFPNENWDFSKGSSADFEHESWVSFEGDGNNKHFKTSTRSEKNDNWGFNSISQNRFRKESWASNPSSPSVYYSAISTPVIGSPNNHNFAQSFDGYIHFFSNLM